MKDSKSTDWKDKKKLWIDQLLSIKMSEEENFSDDPEYKIFTRFDRIRDKKFRRDRNVEQLERLLKRDIISETMATNLRELLDINPAYYWPRKYRYTLEPNAGMNNPLTVQQRNFFERNGYLVSKKLITKEIIDLIRDCPRNIIGDILPLIINQRELILKAKTFCGQSIQHIATMIIDNSYNQSINSSLIKNELNTDIAQLSQYFYQFNIHPSDRLIGCLVCIENSNEIQVYVEPATHQSSILEIEMRDSNGELIKKIYEKPIRKLETLHEQTERRQLISLKPGDVFFYHPLLAQSLKIEQEFTSQEGSSNETKDQILALNVFFGSTDLTKVIRNWGTNYNRSANHKSPFERLKLLDQLDNNSITKDQVDEIVKIVDQIDEQNNDDLKLFNVQIYIGNSIVNLEKVLADAGQENLATMKSHL